MINAPEIFPRSPLAYPAAPITRQMSFETRIFAKNSKNLRSKIPRYDYIDCVSCFMHTPGPGGLACLACRGRQ